MNILYNAVSEETAFIVDNYPWGFRLKTEAKFWIETNKRGGRTCQRTKNPKTGNWCKVKKSTYDSLMILTETNGCYGVIGVDMYSELDSVKNFKEEHWEHLNELQRKELLLLIAHKEVMRNVTFTVEECPVGPVSLTSRSPEDIAKREAIIKHQEGRKREQIEIRKNICKAISSKYHALKEEVTE